MMESPQEPGGWIAEVNQWGGIKYFRWVNGVKEYELETLTSHGKMTRSQLDAFNRDENEKRNQTRIIRPAKPSKICPFKSGISVSCSDKCAFFDEGCKIAQTGQNPEKDTKGLLCPINAVKTECGANCALYNSGCSIISLLTKER